VKNVPENAPLVSIIVPVYKTEKYLAECIESLRNQTLKDIEIILVDDGSPDRCPEICDEYARLDPRIRVIHRPNGGQSKARNAGLDNAIGKYIGFIDSDDYVLPQMFERMYEVIEAEMVDFVLSDYIRVEGDKKTLRTTHLSGGRYSKERIKREVYPHLIMEESIDFGPILSVCNCLYSHKFLQKNRIRFADDVLRSEDCLFSSTVVYLADSFYYMKNEAYYCYRYNPLSLSKTYKPEAWDSACIMNTYLREVFSGASDYDFSRQLDLHFLYFALSAMEQLKLSDLSFREKWMERRKILNSVELNRALHKFRIPADISWKLKIIIILIKLRAAFLLSLIGERK
jgi:glycosyltransferase involved in cell wall biosynthesis